jgi:predicted nucleic acid-binding Zn finger protein
MKDTYAHENQLISELFTELKSRGALSEKSRERVERAFGDRYTNGLKLANSHKVQRYTFTPSGRVVWVVRGRTNEYQVIPELPFCYCDDYYFRVMDRKRGLCYHIIAQRIAEAMDQFNTVQKTDSQYSTITYRWRAKGS